MLLPLFVVCIMPYNENFNLYNVSDENLNNLLKLNNEQRKKYVDTLIERFYPHVIELGDTNTYKSLTNAYISSIEAENVYRNNPTFQLSFQAIYTKTGLIRNLVNDIYFNDDHLITH